MITPNRLSLIRLVLAFILPAVLLWNRTIGMEALVLIGFTAACITDWWDGYLARRDSKITMTGQIIDPIADKLLIFGMMLAFSACKLYSILWLLPILIREVVVTVVRLIALTRGRVIPAEWPES